MDKKTKIIIWVVGIAVIITMIMLSRNALERTMDEPIVIGLSTVLSGDFAAAGENMVNAARLAVEDINATGGINGRTVRLSVQDAGWESKTGLDAAQQLINGEGVKYIVGGTSSNGTLAAAPLANQKHVIYVTPVTGGTNVDDAGEYIFRLANSDLLAGRDIARAMIRMGYVRVAAIAEVTEYTLDMKNTFERTITEMGGEIVASETFGPGTNDFRTIIVKLKASNPQAILIASQTGVGGAYFMKQSQELGWTIPVFSDFTFVVNENAKNIVGSFEGVYFADPAYDAENPKTKEFFARYEEIYKKPSLIPFHAAATYDSVEILVKAIAAVGDDSERVHDWLLQNIKNWQGLMGTFSLDAKGNSDLGFVIKVVKDGKFVEAK